jgi:tRNA threonylcarbamoyladenosine biosynthesis protein TsaE
VETFRSSLPSESITIAQNFSSQLSGGETIGLVGELGAGKTFFSTALVAALGSKEQVFSPSYSLCNEYLDGKFKVEHWDLYRLKNLVDELYQEVAKDTIRIIEWANLFPNIELNYNITIEISAERDERTFKISQLK